jgi:hypothetical protein
MFALIYAENAYDVTKEKKLYVVLDGLEEILYHKFTIYIIKLQTQEVIETDTIY